MNFVYLILVLCASFMLQPLMLQHFCCAGYAFHAEMTEGSVFRGRKTELSCTCPERTKKENPPMTKMEKVFNSIPSGKFCQEDCKVSGDMYGKNADVCKQQEICELFHQCHNCSAMIEKCVRNDLGTDTKYQCHRQHIFITPNLNSRENKEIYMDDILEHLKREPRAARRCRFPKVLQTSEIDCTIYPSSVKCMQKCQFGYTMKEGIKRRMTCMTDEDVWKPTGFEECEPFIDCSLKLVAPGALKCGSATAMDPPSCNVSCFSTGEKKGTPIQNFICRISGTWDKKLPHCVSTKSVLNLVAAPRIRLHPKDDFIPWAPSAKKQNKIDQQSTEAVVTVSKKNIER